MGEGRGGVKITERSPPYGPGRTTAPHVALRAVSRAVSRAAAHAALPVTPPPALAPLPADPDVVVVGAGAAGIGAARRLIARGLTVAVLEARDHLGGRAVTTRLSGHPIDLGAHWLHAGTINPLVALGHGLGPGVVRLRRAPSASHLVVGRRRARPEEGVAFGRAFDLADRSLNLAAVARRAEGRDVPAAEAFPRVLGPWTRRVRTIHGLVAGLPLDEVSLSDFPSMEFGHNWFVAGGLGAYLARLARGLPIALGRPVHRLDWSGPGVAVDLGGAGRLRARAAIVTASAMVMNPAFGGEAALAFAPALPQRTRAAIDAFRPGIYEHVVLRWARSPFAGPDRLAGVTGGRLDPPGLLTRIDGTPFHYFELDAPAAARLDALGPERRADAARRFARAVLAQHFPDRLAGLAAPVVTEWRHDPWARGSWAVVPPGHPSARDDLAVPVGERVWFAGEALSHRQWGTTGGAWEEAERAADEVAERLGGARLSRAPESAMQKAG